MRSVIRATFWLLIGLAYLEKTATTLLLFREGRIAVFINLRLRLRAELDGLKLYFLFASRRDRATNMAKITFNKIEGYSGLARNDIRRALTLLAANALGRGDNSLIVLCD